MIVHSCPKGHQSSEADYCSECGSKLDAAAVPHDRPVSYLDSHLANVLVGELQLPRNTENSPSVKDAMTCPDCSTLHPATEGIFCEICGYNFQTQAHGELPIGRSPTPNSGLDSPLEVPLSEVPLFEAPLSEVALSEVALSEAPLISVAPIQPMTPNGGAEAATASQPVTQAKKWRLEIRVDPSLAHPDSPPAPSPTPQMIDIAKTLYLIGRTSETRANYPDIPLDFDEAVSHRHAVLTLDVDQMLTLRDIGSSNGTYVNGIEIKPMADISLKPGDVVNLGHWTKLTIH